jgi:hypothetical protein
VWSVVVMSHDWQLSVPCVCVELYVATFRCVDV